MAKTIVIGGANYTSNALDKVSFSGSVPCTGIEFEESSYSLTDYTPVTIEYTLTPADTTDTLTWSSSDDDVVTIENGIITAVGLGSATITATCGTQTATATVSVSLAYVPKYELGMYNHTNNSTYVSNGSSVTNRIMCMGSGAQASEYIIPAGSQGYENVHCIKLPKNTASVTVSFSTTTKLYYGDAPILYWCKDEPCGETGALENAALYVGETTAYNAKSETSKTFTVPNSADCFVYFFRLSANAGEGDTADSLAEDVGIEITFNVAT